VTEHGERVGANRLSALQRVVTIAKLTTLLSGVLTILCAAVIFGVQITAWIQTGTWDAYRLASVIRTPKISHANVYVTASVSNFATELTNTQAMIDWLLEIPTTALFLVVAALNFAFYLYVLSFEEQRKVREHRQSDAGSRRRFLVTIPSNRPVPSVQT
jgi:hypothetical protein